MKQNPMFEKIMRATTEVLQKLVKSNKKIDGAINWGDLSCEDVEYVEAYRRSDKFWRVTISEVAHGEWDFQSLVQDKLKAKGFDVEVVTDW